MSFLGRGKDWHYHAGLLRKCPPLEHAARASAAAYLNSYFDREEEAHLYSEMCTERGVSTSRSGGTDICK